MRWWRSSYRHVLRASGCNQCPGTRMERCQAGEGRPLGPSTCPVPTGAKNRFGFWAGSKSRRPWRHVPNVTSASLGQGTTTSAVTVRRLRGHGWGHARGWTTRNPHWLAASLCYYTVSLLMDVRRIAQPQVHRPWALREMWSWHRTNTTWAPALCPHINSGCYTRTLPNRG